MPIHDWTRVDAGLFHAFHQSWISSLCSSLNTGGLPADYFALAQLSNPEPGPDELSKFLATSEIGRSHSACEAIEAAISPPRIRFVHTSEVNVYRRKINRVEVRHGDRQIVAVIEIVSPGNKGSDRAIRAFVEKTSDLIEQGINVLMIDLFPPTKRDPQGLHNEIWDALEGEVDDFVLPPDQRLTIASYDAGPIRTAYIEPVAVNQTLPDMPLFLKPEHYVPVPLEATYQTSWNGFPKAMKPLLEEQSGKTDV